MSKLTVPLLLLRPASVGFSSLVALFVVLHRVYIAKWQARLYWLYKLAILKPHNINLKANKAALFACFINSQQYRSIQVSRAAQFRRCTALNDGLYILTVWLNDHLLLIWWRRKKDADGQESSKKSVARSLTNSANSSSAAPYNQFEPIHLVPGEQ